MVRVSLWGSWVEKEIVGSCVEKEMVGSCVEKEMVGSCVEKEIVTGRSVMDLHDLLLATWSAHLPKNMENHHDNY